jgi:hypothetical protein
MVPRRLGDPTVAIPLTEEILPIARAMRAWVPARRGDRPAHASCGFRWAKYGLRGIRLETIRIGGTLCTSRQAMERFFTRLAELDDADAGRGDLPASRRLEIAEAARKAEAALR